MPIESNITKDGADDGRWFANTSVQLVFAAFENDGVTPSDEDMSGWHCDWMFKRDIDDADADALIHKTGGSVFLGAHPETGDPAWFVQIEDSDTDDIEF